MISALANDLVAKLNGITGLVGKVGLATGGRGSDPALSKAPLPLAWAFFQSMKPMDPPAAQQATSQAMQLDFRVFVIVPYISQDDMQAVQLPLIQSAITSIRGSVSPSRTKWRFESADQRQINTDRIYFELRFSINSYL